MGVIYKLTCVCTGKIYIGQTKHTTRHRWNQHVYEAKHDNDINTSRLLNRSINKYGANHFIVEDLFHCEDDLLDEWEIRFIAIYNTFDNGLNLTDGGKRFKRFSETSKNKISKSTKGVPKKSTSRKRIEDNILPKYVKHCVNEKYEGYRISDHPKMPQNHTITLVDSNIPLEDKLKRILDILVKIEDGSYIFTRKTLPVGISLIKNGYRVRLLNHPVRTFQKENLTMDQKLRLAQQYLQTITN